MRAFLTVLGMVIGVASIVVMVSLGIGIKQATIESFAGTGSLTTIRVNSYSWVSNGKGGGTSRQTELNKKSVSRILIRAELATGATMKAYLKYDSGSTWEEKASLTASTKKSFTTTIIPRRSDHWRLKLTGTGDVTVHAIAREYATGTEL